MVLCGGRGERLRPLTNDLPKPMVEVNGRPFLFYLLDQLSFHGVKRFVLLTGYLGESIYKYFGDGSTWGWSITYSHGPTEWLTATRVSKVIDDLDEKFLLLYSDNFAQLRMSELIGNSSKNRSGVTLSIVEKSPGNIEIDPDGLVVNYDESRTASSSNYVEIGYSLIVKAQISEHLKRSSSESFAVVIKQLVKDRKVSAFVVKSGYKSISDPVRLEQTSNFLKPKKVLLLDRDGTLNEKAAPGEYINSLDQFLWIDSSRQALRILGDNGFRFIVITNQAGVSIGRTKADDLNEIHNQLRADFAHDGLNLLDIYVCTDHWASESEFRKPKPGMFFQASKDHDLRLDHIIYIGDDARDGLAAGNAGCECLLISASPYAEVLDPSVVLVGKSLLDLVPTILEKYQHWSDLVK